MSVVSFARTTQDSSQSNIAPILFICCWFYPLLEIELEKLDYERTDAIDLGVTLAFGQY